MKIIYKNLCLVRSIRRVVGSKIFILNLIEEQSEKAGQRK